MIGTIIGDIAGSTFEFDNCRTKDFDLFAPDSRLTDDSVMSLALAQALLETDADPARLPEAAADAMRAWGAAYPDAGYGGRFKAWLTDPAMPAYNSWGNGSAMRAGPCAWAAENLESALLLARASALPTHNHPEGIRGAQAVSALTFLARSGADKQALRRAAQHFYPHDYGGAFTIDALRPHYTFDVSCAGSVPHAVEAFLESTDFEDAVRTAVSLGGDSDTIAAIAGSIAESYYGVPKALRARALCCLDARQREALTAFETRCGAKTA